MTKFVFVTGGVSFLSNGIAIPESRGLNGTLLKLDPYLNIDPDTMSLSQHGEVVVTDDGTHFVQLPAGQKTTFGGQHESVPVLSRAAAAGIAGIFMEAHPQPAEAQSDAPNAVPFVRTKKFFTTLVAFDKVVKGQRLSEAGFA